MSRIIYQPVILGRKGQVSLFDLFWRTDEISMKNIISGKMILAVWKEVFQESILEMKTIFKLNMSRTIDVLSEPDSNSDHRNNVFAEPMTHLNPDNILENLSRTTKILKSCLNHILWIEILNAHDHG